MTTKISGELKKAGRKTTFADEKSILPSIKMTCIIPLSRLVCYFSAVRTKNNSREGDRQEDWSQCLIVSSAWTSQGHKMTSTKSWLDRSQAILGIQGRRGNHKHARKVLIPHRINTFIARLYAICEQSIKSYFTNKVVFRSDTWEIDVFYSRWRVNHKKKHSDVHVTAYQEVMKSSPDPGARLMKGRKHSYRIS